MTSEWQRLLGEAKDKAKLIAVANAYLASWPREDLATLPADCFPGPIEDLEDIRRCVVRLSELYCESQADTSPQFRQLLAFFMAALERHGQLATQRNEGEEALRKHFSERSRPRLFLPKKDRR